jgi:hypothetical protein
MLENEIWILVLLINLLFISVEAFSSFQSFIDSKKRKSTQIADFLVFV